MESKFVQVQGKNMHYTTYPDSENADKPVCIFIHGASPESQHTEFWTPILEIITKYCQPIFLDGYGHGESAQPEVNEQVTFNVHVSIYTDFIKAVLEEEKIDSFILIGRSLGGAITHTVAKNFESNLLAIGLIAPAGATRTKESLKFWTKKVSVLWDSKDPAVSFESYPAIEATVKQVKLFAVGADPILKCEKNWERDPNKKPSHVPELHYPELFEAFLESLVK